MSKKPLLFAAGAIVLLGVSAAACTGDTDDGTPTATSTYVDAMSDAVTESSSSTPTSPTRTTRSDPYNTDGTWLVPSDIAPGNYRVLVDDSAFAGMGYVEVCGDAACEIGTPGFLSNEVYQGPGVLSVPPNAFSVELNNVALVPLGG